MALSEKMAHLSGEMTIFLKSIFWGRGNTNDRNSADNYDIAL